MKKLSILSLALLGLQINMSNASATPFIEDLRLEINGSTGALHRASGSALPWGKYWQNTTYADIATVKFTAETDITDPHPANCATGSGVLKMIPASTTAYDYVLSINENSQYYISSYSFTAVPSAGNEQATINGEVLGAEGITFSANNLDENIHQYNFTLISTMTGPDKPIELRDFVVTLSPIPEQNASGLPFYARELDNKYAKLYVNDSNRYLFLNENLDGLSHGNNTADRANVWHFEYVTKTAADGTSLNGLRISSKGRYLGKMPTAKSAALTVTTDPEQAGLWRIFPYENTYLLSCSEYQDGSVVVLNGFGGADEVNKNAWIQIGSGAVQRWGMYPDAARWNIIIVPQVEYTLNCDGVTVITTGIPGETIATENLVDLPLYFVPNPGNLTIPAAGGTLEVPGSWQFPFELEKPYFLTLHQGSGNNYSHVYYNGTNIVNKNVNAAHLTLNPYLVWYFKDGGIVDNTKVVTLHNISTETNLGIHATLPRDGEPCTITDDLTKLAVNNNGDGFGLRIASTTNTYINEYGGGGTMAIWSSNGGHNDLGCRMWVAELTDADFNVESWIAHDGFTYTYDSAKLETARTAKTLEALRELFAYVPKTDINHDEVISAIKEDAAYNSLLTRMVQTGLFNSETASAKIFDALGIPEESDDFMSVLEAKKSELANLTASELVTKFLNGKKIMIKCNSWYIKKTLSKGDGSLTIDAAWEFTADANNGFTLRNPVDGKYAIGLDVTDNEAEATHYLLANETVKNNGSFAIQNPDQSGNNFLNNNTGSQRLRYWSANSDNGQSFWTLHLVTPEMEQGWVNNAIAAITPQANLAIGDEPGMLSDLKPEERAAKIAELQAMRPGNIDYPAVYAVNSDDYFAIFDLNSIEAPALIQMAYTPNANVNSYNGFWNGNNQVTDSNINNDLAFGTDASTFVLDDHKLHSFNSGLGIISTSNGPAMFTGENWEENAQAMNVDFCKVNKSTLVAVPDGTHRHTYALKQIDTGNTFGAHSDDNTHHRITWGQNDGMPEANYAYSVWYVKELTVEVAEGTIKLWRTPVTVSFADRYSHAYLVSVEGTEITTAQIEGDETKYGAGSIFLLTGSVTLNVHNGVTTASAPTAGIGHHIKRMHTMHPGKVYLSIHVDDAQQSGRVAPMKEPSMYSTSDKTYIKLDAIVPDVETSKLLEAHEALIEANNNPQKIMKDGETMDIELGGTTPVKISEITIDDANANTLYDLMGRRLAAPIKGINIVNGKKIMVK